MSDPICDVCGGETVHDRREGRIVCIECGGVLEEWTICDDTYEASTRCAPSDWDLGTGNAPKKHVYAVKRRRDVRHSVRHRVADIVASRGMGTAVSSRVDDMLGALDASRINEKESTAWTLIALACESVKAPRPIGDMAACAGISKGKLIEAMDALRPGLADFFEADAVGNDLETSLRRVLDTIFPVHDRVPMMEARKGAMRIAQGLQTDGGFMNVQPQTQARVLLLAHFDAAGVALDARMRSALKVNSGAKALVTRICQRPKQAAARPPARR